jgi:hypothetical protein
VLGHSRRRRKHRHHEHQTTHRKCPFNRAGVVCPSWPARLEAYMPAPNPTMSAHRAFHEFKQG